MKYTVYHIVSTRIVNAHHSRFTIILPLQKADGSCRSVWACGMFTKELLQSPMMMVSSRIFVRPTGLKTSKIAVLIVCKLERERERERLID